MSQQNVLGILRESAGSFSTNEGKKTLLILAELNEINKSS
jgi:hypothetical protein